MSFIQVTSQELRAKADELNILNQKFATEVETMVSSQGNLNTMWEGDAKEAFNTAFNQDKAKFDNFKNAIEAYIQSLLGIAGKYEEAERRNYQIAGQRTY